jgi:hypothetical protein
MTEIIPFAVHTASLSRTYIERDIVVDNLTNEFSRIVISLDFFFRAYDRISLYNNPNYEIYQKFSEPDFNGDQVNAFLPTVSLQGYIIQTKIKRGILLTIKADLNVNVLFISNLELDNNDKILKNSIPEVGGETSCKSFELPSIQNQIYQFLRFGIVEHMPKEELDKYFH